MSHFSMLVPTKHDVKLANGTLHTPKELGLFHVCFLNAPLNTQKYQFIIVQVTIKIPYHWVPSDVLLVFERLYLNLFDIVIFLPLRSFLEITLPD